MNQTILVGGGAYGGKMTAFKNTLSQAEINAAIASFQQYRSDELYKDWLTMDKQSRQ